MRLWSTRSAAFAALTLVLALLSCSDGNLLAPAGDPLLSTSSTAPAVVISQVYGGGGNSGATLRNDFIELFNPGTQPVSLAGWSVQYASATGTSWQATALTGTIQPGGYYLVQQAAGAGGTTSLPAPDATGTIAMSATAGKVALVSATAALTGSCPASGVVDLVGFGSTANCFRGAGPTGTLSNTTAALRKNGGCSYTNDNAADFEVGAPAPRNSSSPTRACAATQPAQPAKVTVTPASATIVVGGTQAFTAKAFDSQGQEISGVTFAWSSDKPAIASVDANGVATAAGVGTATITAAAPNQVAGSATLTVEAAPPPAASNVRVTEFHYDNEGTDTGEAIELEGDAGGSLSGWRLVLYNGTPGSSTQGKAYSTVQLSGTFGNACGGTRGVLVFDAPGLQNGDADGFALVDAAGRVVEFLSYEGTLTATDGPAAGTSSVDVGVAQASNTKLGRSLQRAGNGVWFGPYTQTFGSCNPATPPPPITGITFSGRHPSSDPPLPVGFEDQIFATLRDDNTGAVVPTTFTWTSETPSIASIDERGVMRALAAGTAVIRATAADGTSATYSLPTRVGAASTTAQYGHNTEFGVPADGDASDDLVVVYDQFTSSWNRTRGTPNWVSYNIDATHFGAEDRCDCFTYDPSLPPAERYTTADYTGAGTFHGYGIDRGHLARSFDRTSASLDNARTYYFTNIIPQASDNNQGPWAVMENYLGDLARRDNREVYVIAGVAGSKGTIKNEGKITIPASTWKVALILPRDKGLADVRSYQDAQVVAVIMPNDAGIRNVNWETYKTTVDAVEALSGYDVLALLPDPVEIALESGTRPPTAVAGGPYAGSEGSAVSLSASGSSDPDGHALTFAWSFGDGTSGTGATVSHTYRQDGKYTVRLIATDPLGLADTTTATVNVANVAPQVAAFAGATLLPGETYAASGSFTDPGADDWSATVNYGDGSGAKPLALSGKSFSLSHTYAAAGTFTVSVRVSDDDAAGTQTATVLVKTHRQAIEDLDRLVRDLVAAGRLQAGLGTSLRAKLNAAEIQLQRDGAAAAVNQLRAFVNEVEGLRDGGQLAAADATTLIGAAERVIRSLSR